MPYPNTRQEWGINEGRMNLANYSATVPSNDAVSISSLSIRQSCSTATIDLNYFD
jgi:hypothetical protein